MKERYKTFRETVALGREADPHGTRDVFAALVKWSCGASIILSDVKIAPVFLACAIGVYVAEVNDYYGSGKAILAAKAKEQDKGEAE